MTMRLRTLLGDHPGTSALKDGSLRSDLVGFDFAAYSPTNKGFKPMVRGQAFDVAEMAIVTYLMPEVSASRWCCCRAWWSRGISTPTRSTGPISAT